MRRGLHRLGEAAGDGLAHARQLLDRMRHARIEERAGFFRHFRRWSGLGGSTFGRRRCCATRSRSLNVGLDDTTIGTAALDHCKIDTQFGGEALGHRRNQLARWSRYCDARRLRRAPARLGGLDIGPDNPAIGATALQSGKIDAHFGSEALGQRGSNHTVTFGHGRSRGGFRHCGS